MARLPINSCDFSLESYNYDNVAGDSNLDHFSIDHDKQLIIPFIKQAIETRKKWSNSTLNIVASPWSTSVLSLRSTCPEPETEGWGSCSLENT